MAFRADEATRLGAEQAENYLLHKMRDLDFHQKARSAETLQRVIDKFGPAVDGYPSWHPLVANQDPQDTFGPHIYPNDRCGYEGLDHTQYFANAFITCPYGDGFEKVVESVRNLAPHPVARIYAEVLDVKLYNTMATPVLVYCEWHRPLAFDGTIPLALAAPLILQTEVPCWKWAQVAESWERMRPYLLGEPHGSRSSLFVNQETGQGIKKLWNTVIETGMFGPVRQ